LATQKATIENHDCGCMDLIPVLFCAPCCQLKVRSRIREKYNIEGSCIGDLVISACCGLCVLVQQTKQLVHRGDKPGGIFKFKKKLFNDDKDIAWKNKKIRTFNLF
jgi:hypothetical protein